MLSFFPVVLFFRRIFLTPRGLSRSLSAHSAYPELALRLQDERVNYLTQVEIPVTTADFYFPLESRPLIVFVDGPVHMKMA